jgi:hypothetical protein
VRNIETGALFTFLKPASATRASKMRREIAVSTPTLTLVALVALGPLFALMGLMIAGQAGGFHVDNLPSIVISSVPHNMSVTVENEPGVSVLNFPALQNVSVVNFPELQQVNVTNFPDVQIVLEQNPPARTASNVQKATLVGPTTAFGDLSVAQLAPVFQVDSVYSMLSLTSQVIRSFAAGGASVTNSDSTYQLTPGAGVATFQSRKRVRYHAGEGIRLGFSARFVPDLPGSQQSAGLGHGEDGVGFGYDDTDSTSFGVFHYSRGKRPVYTLTVTSGSSTAESATITLAGVPYLVTITNAAGNTLRTAWEISQGSFPGWQAQVSGSTVIFSYGFATPLTGTFSLTATTAVGSFATTQVGVVYTLIIVPQTQWNGADTLNGTGASGMLLDPSKFNSYQISMQYFGAGAIYFYVEIPDGTYALVHTMQFPNTRTLTTFGNPAFPFAAVFRNVSMGAGAPAPAPMEVSSFAGFIEGKKVYTGARFSIDNALLSTVDQNAYYVLFSFTNPIWYSGRTAQGILNVINIGGSVTSTPSVTLYVFRTVSGDTHNLGGTPNFQQYSPTAALWVDKSATTFTPTSNSQLVWTAGLGTAGFIRQNIGTPEYDDLTLQPGDIISVCARARAAPAANYVTATVDIRQDY